MKLIMNFDVFQPTHEGYFSCLDIWTLFLDYLTSKIKSRLADKEAVLNRWAGRLGQLKSLTVTTERLWEASCCLQLTAVCDLSPFIL